MSRIGWATCPLGTRLPMLSINSRQRDGEITKVSPDLTQAFKICQNLLSRRGLTLTHNGHKKK